MVNFHWTKRWAYKQSGLHCIQIQGGAFSHNYFLLTWFTTSHYDQKAAESWKRTNQHQLWWNLLPQQRSLPRPSPCACVAETYEKRVYMNAAKSTSHRLCGVHSIISNKWNFQVSQAVFQQPLGHYYRGARFTCSFKMENPLADFYAIRTLRPQIQSGNPPSRLNLFSSVNSSKAANANQDVCLLCCWFEPSRSERASQGFLRIRSFLTLLWLELFRRK